MAFGAMVAGLCANGCHKHSPPADGTAGVAASASAAPIDRLAPGELLPGDQTVYGLVLPRGMVIASAMPGVAHAIGPVSPEDASNYIRDRVDVRRVELGAVGTFFPAVHILAGDSSRVYRIEVNFGRTGTRLRKIVVRDVTPQADARSGSETSTTRSAGVGPGACADRTPAGSVEPALNAGGGNRPLFSCFIHCTVGG